MNQVADASPRTEPSRRTIWRDTFQGPAGAPPDPALWHVVTGRPFGAGIESHADDPAHVALDGAGRLRITATAEPDPDGGGPLYRAGWIETVRDDLLPPAGGALRISATLRTAPGPGLDCALWTWGAQLRHRGDEDPVQAWYRAGEIDVLEALGSEPDRVWGAVHSPPCRQIPSLGMGASTATPDAAALSDGFHTYTAVWRRDPDSITWLLDGRPFLRLTPQDTTPEGWLFNQPVYLCLAVIIGSPGGPVPPGEPDPRLLPAELLVEEISIVEETGTIEETGAIDETGAIEEPTG